MYAIGALAATGAAFYYYQMKTPLGLAPVRQIHQEVCGIHMYDGEPERQVIAYHFCSHLNDDVRQCVIYDSDKPSARLIGIEYIISDKVFKTLPEEEKRYWHSHVYEVKSGLLVAPGVPELAEKSEMKKLITTYGKTYHTWQVDVDKALPLGPARLMMALTKDGMVSPSLVAKKDELTGIQTGQRRHSREDIPAPAIDKGADRGLKSTK